MNISATDLRRAASIKDKIEILQSELEQILGNKVGNSVRVARGKARRRGPRKMSATAKAEIAAAQRARWAKWKASRK